MSEPTPNIPLLRKCVEWAEAEAAKPIAEREWDQADWRTPADVRFLRNADGSIARDEHGYALKVVDVNPSCGTSYCIAGYACEVSGVAWAPRHHSQSIDLPGLPHAGDHARGLLGLDHDQAKVLFHATNTAEDVRRIAEEIAGERL